MQNVKRNANGYRIGDSHHNSRYTDHEIDLVHRLRAQGWKIREIAAKMGMSRGHVCDIINLRART